MGTDTKICLHIHTHTQTHTHIPPSNIQAYEPDVILIDGTFPVDVEMSEHLFEVLAKVSDEDLFDLIHEPFLIPVVDQTVVENPGLNAKS